MRDLLDEHGARNAPVFEQLDKAGTTGERRRVDYVFVGPRAGLRALRAALKRIGFTVGPVGDRLVVSETVGLEEAVLSERTAFLELEAAKHGVEFDGWETALFEPEQSPPAQATLPKPGGIWALPLPDGRYGYVHVVGASKSAGVFCHVLEQTTEGRVDAPEGLDLSRSVYRQPVFFDPWMAGLELVGNARPDYAAITARGIYFRLSSGQHFAKEVALGLVDVDPVGPPDFSPEALQAYERRRSEVLARAGPIPLTDWRLFSFRIDRSGKAKRGLDFADVAITDERLTKGYPFGRCCGAQDVAAALSGDGVDTYALEDRTWIVGPGEGAAPT